MHAVVTFIAQDLIIIPLLAIVFVLFKLPRHRRPGYAVFVVLSGLLTYIFSRLASLMHHVPRPFVHDHVTPYFKSALDNGFPSDHTLMAAFGAFIVLRYFRKTGFGLLVLALAIGTARVMGNVHHGQDIVGGFAMAALGVIAGYYGSRFIASIPAQKRRLKNGVFLAIVAVLVVLAAIVYRLEKQSNKPVTAAPRGSYVALGDSVAAGVGLGSYVDSSACDRTTESYPTLLAKQQNLRLISFACSGATVPDGILASQTVNAKALPPQLNALFEQHITPNLITLTIGANDANWTGFLKKCYIGECGDASDKQTVSTALNQLAINLNIALRQISEHYKGAKPQIVVTGYYQLFPATEPQNCSDLTGIDGSELAWGRQLQSDISTTIATAAHQVAGVTYVPISFAGHELCSANSWVQSLNDSQPYHPTKAGQAAISQQISKALK